MTVPIYNWPALDLAPRLIKVSLVDPESDEEEYDTRFDTAAVFAAANGWSVQNWDYNFSLNELRAGREFSEEERDQDDSWICNELYSMELSIAPDDADEYYREGDRPVAIVIHLRDHNAVPSFPSIRADPLPASWYRPDPCRAWLLRSNRNPATPNHQWERSHA